MPGRVFIYVSAFWTTPSLPLLGELSQDGDIYCETLSPSLVLLEQQGGSREDSEGGHSEKPLHSWFR